MGFSFSGALKAVGTVVDAYSQFKGGQDAKDVYQYNAALAEYQAEYIQEAADLEIADLERDVADFVARQRAITGKSGTVVDKGSSADSIARSYRERDIDAGLIRWRASKDIEMTKRGANLLETQADQFAKAGTINAGTTLLSGLSKWDWKTSSLGSPSSPAYKRPPVSAGSGYIPSR